MRAVSVRRAQSFSTLERVLLALFLSLILFFGGLVLAIFGYQVWYAGRIFPGVHVAGIDLSGLQPGQAANKISQQLEYPLKGRVLMRDGQQAWESVPVELGLFLDADTAARQAFGVGRSGFLIQDLPDQFNTWYYGRDLPPAVILDGRMTFDYLAAIGQQINRPVVETSMGLQGTEVIVRSGQVGRELDISNSMALLLAQMQSFQDGVLDLVIKETPPVIVDVKEQVEQARRILIQPLILVVPSDQGDKMGPWTFEPATLANMLSIERVQNSESTKYQVTVKAEILRKFLTDLKPGFQRSAVNARFTFNDKTSQLELLQPSVIGRSLDVDATIRSIQEKLVKGEHTIPLVLIFTPPAVTDQSTGEKLGIRELVRQEISYFTGSAGPRIQNIKLASARFHGLMVAPGETFSMAQALGDISLDNGYAEALIIVGDLTVKGVGGGVCQVSTTLFRTAFFNGFPIVERHAHAYRVSYYERVAGNKFDSRLAGLDATVYFPLVDLKFKNDTPYWLLMETYVNTSAGTLTWKFYSTSDGRKVAWETSGVTSVVEPPLPSYKENPDLKKGEIRQVDWEADGADVMVNRTVTRAGATIIKDTIRTHYQPWQAKYEYGPGTEDIPTSSPSH